MDATAEDLIDVVEGDRVYIPCIYVLNKIDQISIQARKYPRFVTLFVALLVALHYGLEQTRIET